MTETNRNSMTKLQHQNQSLSSVLSHILVYLTLSDVTILDSALCNLTMRNLFLDILKSETCLNFPALFSDDGNVEAYNGYQLLGSRSPYDSSTFLGVDFLKWCCLRKISFRITSLALSVDIMNMNTDLKHLSYLDTFVSNCSYLQNIFFSCNDRYHNSFLRKIPQGQDVGTTHTNAPTLFANLSMHCPKLENISLTSSCVERSIYLLNNVVSRIPNLLTLSISNYSFAHDIETSLLSAIKNCSR
jgi:hypothetical protein